MPTVDHIDESALQPIRCTDLSRLGSPHDGGYVVSVRALRRASTLVSLGLSVDWNFERAALALNPGLTIHAYDHTVGPTPPPTPMRPRADAWQETGPTPSSYPLMPPSR